MVKMNILIDCADSFVPSLSLLLIYFAEGPLRIHALIVHQNFASGFWQIPKSQLTPC